MVGGRSLGGGLNLYCLAGAAVYTGTAGQASVCVICHCSGTETGIGDLPCLLSALEND